MSTARKVASRLAGGLLACCIAAAAPVAVAQPGETTPAFAAGSAAFAAGDYAAALRQFEQALEQGSSGPAVHYNIGVCEYRLGRYAAAAETFRLVAFQFPAMRALAEYNLGLALAQLGRSNAARAALARAEGGGDETVARLAAAMLGRLDGETAGEARALVALVDVGAGHDDNVALVDELSLPAAEAANSAFVETVGYVDVPLDDAGRFAFEATGYAVDYRDVSRYDQVALRVALDYGPSQAERVTLGPYYERTQLGGLGFEERLGFEVDVSTAVGDRGAMSVRVGVAGVDALDGRYAFVAGDQQRLRARYRQALAGGAFSATYDFESNDRDAASVSPTRKRLSLDWRRRLGAHWEAALGLRHRRSDYDEVAAPRKEELGEVRLDLARDLGRSWQVRGGVHLSDNDATDPVYSYEREVLSLGLRRVF